MLKINQMKVYMSQILNHLSTKPYYLNQSIERLLRIMMKLGKILFKALASNPVFINNKKIQTTLIILKGIEVNYKYQGMSRIQLIIDCKALMKHLSNCLRRIYSTFSANNPFKEAKIIKI